MATITVTLDANRTLTLKYITNTLEGWVVNAYTRDPIAGATVSCAGRTTTSASDGKYLLSGLPLGTVTVTASKSGYDLYALNQEIHPGKNFFTILMTPTAVPPPPTKGNLEGYINAGGWGNAVAEIVETGQRAISLYEPAGYYKITDIPVGTYTVRFARVMFQEKIVSGVKINGGQTTRLDVTLTRT